MNLNALIVAVVVVVLPCFVRDEDGVDQNEDDEEAEPVNQVPVARTASLHRRRR